MPRKPRPGKPGKPPAAWMRKVAEYKVPDKNTITDYQAVAIKFGTTVKALRKFSERISYDAEYVGVPEGGIIKKFKLADFVDAVRHHVLDRQTK